MKERENDDRAVLLSRRSRMVHLGTKSRRNTKRQRERGLKWRKITSDNKGQMAQDQVDASHSGHVLQIGVNASLVFASSLAMNMINWCQVNNHPLQRYVNSHATCTRTLCRFSCFPWVGVKWLPHKLCLCRSMCVKVSLLPFLSSN